ncbi:MAG: hypothetical protein ACI4XA_06640, partial [Oscillospiraceae bacterium]
PKGSSSHFCENIRKRNFQINNKSTHQLKINCPQNKKQPYIKTVQGKALIPQSPVGQNRQKKGLLFSAAPLEY